MNDRSPLANPGVFPFESRHGHNAPVGDSYSMWKDWRAADFGRVNCEESLSFERELQATGIGKPAGLRVGEIGYGNGAFAGWACRAGAHWIGRETNQALQVRAVESGFDIPCARFESERRLGKQCSRSHRGIRRRRAYESLRDPILPRRGEGCPEAGGGYSCCESPVATVHSFRLLTGVTSLTVHCWAPALCGNSHASLTWK